MVGPETSVLETETNPRRIIYATDFPGSSCRAFLLVLSQISPSARVALHVKHWLLEQKHAEYHVECRVPAEFIRVREVAFQLC